MMLRSQANQAAGDSSNVVHGEVSPGPDGPVTQGEINDNYPSGFEDVPEVRRSAPTQRYTEYRVDQLELNFRSAVSMWRRCATRLEKLLSESVDILPLKQCCDRLMRCMGDVSETYDRYQTLPSSVKADEVFTRYDEIERDNHRLVKNTGQLIKEINDMNNIETRSTVSRKSGFSSKAGSTASGRSKSSNASKRIDAAVDAAAIKAKLECMEATEQRRVEFMKAKAIEDLRIAEAKLNAIDLDAIGVDSKPTLPNANLTTAENVQRYLRGSVDAKPALHHDDFCATHMSSDSVDAKPEAHHEYRAIQTPITKRGQSQIINATVSDCMSQKPSNVYGNEFAPRDNPAQLSQQAPAEDVSERNHLLDVISILSQQVSAGRLPIPEPVIFSGDPLTYPLWKSSFDILIGRKGIPSTEKIFYLKKYLGGTAKEAVEGYFLLSTDDAFQEAMHLLEQRYGNPFVIANAFRDRLDSWQTVPDRDGPSLRKFADFLRQCARAMVSIHSLSCLNDEREIRKILAKLPDWLILRWGRMSSEWRNQYGVFPPFTELVQFIAKEADIACDPITSLQAVKSNDTDHREWSEYRPRRKGATSCATDSTETVVGGMTNLTPWCIMCSKTHTLEQCKRFWDKSVQERKQFARDKGLCFACLEQGHRSKWCKSRKVCSLCSGKHPTSLHGDRNEPYSDRNEAGQALATSLRTGQEYSTEASRKCSMIVPVYVSHNNDPGTEILVYALLDTQSDTSFILGDTCDKLGAKGFEVSLRLSTMSSCDETIQSKKIPGLCVRSMDNHDRIPLPAVYTREIMPANYSHIPTPEVALRWPHLRRIASELKPLMNIPIALLIGYNCARALAPREVIPPVHNEPYGQRTDLGWGIVGIVEQGDLDADEIGVSHRILTQEAHLSNPWTNASHVALVHRTTVKESLHPEDIAKMMELDFSENKPRHGTFSQEDRQFIDIVSSGIHQRPDRYYEMPLPFKGIDLLLPDNKQMAMHRLMTLKRRFSAKPKYRKDYVEFMEDMVTNGHAEQIPDADVCTEKGRAWFIPHHGVYHPKKPSKIRVVFDCSAKCNGVSLNDRLLQGPDLINGLQGVLCRFRLESVAFTCDIKQMFHQFKVNKEHRDFLRFLWWPEGDITRCPKEYRMNVHLFGAVSSPGCANFALRQVANDNEAEFGSQAAEFVRRDFYVDDGLKSTPSVQEAIKLVQNTRDLCARGGLKLHKFVSNSTELLESISPNDRANEAPYAHLMDDTSPTSVERALGVCWAIEADSFTFRITLKDNPLTRRGILATVSSVYDPLGFVAPVILLGKQILQQMCIERADWDDPVSEALRPRWEQWREGLFHLESLKVSRCLKPKEFGKVAVKEVHHFSDASTKGYGQCSYLRLVDDQNRVHCSFITGKARVTPLKTVTIPRLELTAAVVSVKVSNFLQTELLEKSYLNDATEVFWTDSKVVLGYISNESRRFHVYVANRVQQIREQTSPSQWRYVKTEENPADEGSRGLFAESLLGETKWITGPDFLWDAGDQTSPDGESFSISHTDPEVKCCVSAATVSETVEQSLGLSERLEYFSSWFRARRAVANCLRFVEILKNPIHRKSGQTKSKCARSVRPGQISVAFLQTAERQILRNVQGDAFREELAVLVSQFNSTHPAQCQNNDGKDKPHVQKSSPLYNLAPYLDKNKIIRVGGRLGRSGLSLSISHPVVLPRKHHVTELIVRHFHEKVEHQGRGMTTNEIRSNGYWVLGCSSAVSDVIHKCVQCRKMRRPVEEQRMADLPPERLEPSPPFTFCGVDVFGPWLIKDRRSECKRYGVLFTCLVSRAVHIETANTLTTDSFISALRRFLAIRGPIQQLRSDRGTNFVGAERELRQAFNEMDHRTVRSFLLREECDYIEFKMNVPSASHRGGVWERQIRTVRSVLSSLLKCQGIQLDDESLRTFLYEAAAIVNSRPLSVSNLNDPMSAAPLTPNHLLTMKTKVILAPPGEFQRVETYSRKRWRIVQYLANEFWYRWKREYVQTLQVRPKWNCERRNFQVGDVVLLNEDSLPRNHWPIATVSEVFTDDDMRVRRLRLTVGDSQLDARGRRTRALSNLERPIQKVVLLLPNSKC